MSRYLITFSYDGSLYHGYQRQLGLRTIQGSLEKALTKLNNNKEVIIYASGRTDTGVHALNQTAHFDLDKEISPFKLKGFLNSYPDNDLYIKKVIKVNDDFHARFDVLAKEYLYKINLGVYNPLTRKLIYQYNQPLSLKRIKKALKYLKGSHDFIAFTNKSEQKGSSIRKLLKIKVIKKGNELTFSFLGNGFLRYQIRNMVAALIEIGAFKKDADFIKDLLLNKVTINNKAHSEGLYLSRVIYKQNKNKLN